MYRVPNLPKVQRAFLLLRKFNPTGEQHGRYLNGRLTGAMADFKYDLQFGTGSGM